MSDDLIGNQAGAGSSGPPKPPATPLAAGGDGSSGGSNGNSDLSCKQAWVKSFLRLTNPVVLIAMAIVIFISVLIHYASMGWDTGHFLESMANISFARGVITYLFGVGTIGIAVVLLVFALTEKGGPADARYQHGKEVLSLLLGIFGTIVGFYFGSEAASKGEEALRLHQPRLSVSSAAPGIPFSLTTAVSGGKAPYRFGVTVDRDTLNPADLKENVDPSGWIVKDLTVPAGATHGKQISLTVGVRDAANHQTQQTVKLDVK